MPGPSAITRGALIVLEGLDRSGKSTQCQRLSKYLREQGQRVKYIKFPGKSYSNLSHEEFNVTDRAKTDRPPSESQLMLIFGEKVNKRTM